MSSTTAPATARVHFPGLLSLVQDHGRAGFEHLGVPTSGAFARDLHDAANTLVGNSPADATIEFVGAGPDLTFDEDVVVAITGEVRSPMLGARSLAPWHAVYVPAGTLVRCGPVAGRGYLAVSGGFAPLPVLGSRSRCMLSGLGPDPLTAGASVPVSAGRVTLGRAALAPRGETSPIAVLPGPDLHLLTDAAVAAFTTDRWEVSNDVTRVGVRLSGALPDAPQQSLPSRPMVTGAVQVTPAGTPVLLGPDHGTTGGYPVPFVVADEHVGRLAHLLPGGSVRFALRENAPARPLVPVLDLTAVA